MITRRVPLVEWRHAVERRDTDIKAVVEFSEDAW
jgi:hypothetical protein